MNYFFQADTLKNFREPATFIGVVGPQALFVTAGESDIHLIAKAFISLILVLVARFFSLMCVYCIGFVTVTWVSELSWSNHVEQS